MCLSLVKSGPRITLGEPTNRSLSPLINTSAFIDTHPVDNTQHQDGPCLKHSSRLLDELCSSSGAAASKIAAYPPVLVCSQPKCFPQCSSPMKQPCFSGCH